MKRALRWVKRCISAFGGDPNFIVLSGKKEGGTISAILFLTHQLFLGDSAGGHLAAMAAFTANEKEYQPGNIPINHLDSFTA